MLRLHFVFAAFLLAGHGVMAQHASEDIPLTGQQLIVKYTCPMHPEIVLDHPGKCPKCGMTLIPLRKTAEAPTPLVQSSPGKPRSTEHNRSDHPQGEQHGIGHEMMMRSSINIVDPMSRESSGTSWLPDSTPMYGYMFMFGDDMLMLHGAIFPRYTFVSTQRGDDRLDAPNWAMGMFSHSLGEDTQIGARLMISLDPLTEQGRGYPLLLQSGESWHDLPLHDRQHPHDLFDEVSLALSRQVGADLSGYFYFGYPGEPALGPPTFMHRLSAMDDPDAPIGHHWQDSTHVSFGVATVGAQWHNVKLEGSIFTGREPDENRYDFDRPRFDSYSGRISWNPSPNVALQLSHGWIKSPEALEPQVDRHRTTASAIYNLPIGHDSNWASSLVWGRNSDAGEKTQSVLLESNYERGRDAIYLRWERVEKSGHELVLRRADLSNIFGVHALSLGYVRDLSHGKSLDFGLGLQTTLDLWPNELNRYYGRGPGWGCQIFLRVRPPFHSHDMAGGK